MFYNISQINRSSWIIILFGRVGQVLRIEYFGQEQGVVVSRVHYHRNKRLIDDEWHFGIRLAYAQRDYGECISGRRNRARLVHRQPGIVNAIANRRALSLIDIDQLWGVRKEAFQADLQ